MTDALLEKMGLRNSERSFSIDTDLNSSFKIDWDRIKQLVDSSGKETYTFGIEDLDNDPRTFYNLVFQLIPDEQASEPFLLKYTMTEEFATAYYRGETDLRNFLGEVKKIIIREPTSQERRGVYDDYGEVMVGDDCPRTASLDGNGHSSLNGNSGGTYQYNDTGHSSTYSTTTTTCEIFVQATDWYDCLNSDCSAKVFSETTYEYTQECQTNTTISSSSDYDDTCDPESNSFPILEPEADDDYSNPCKVKRLIENNLSLISKFEELQSLTSSDKEVGFLITQESGNPLTYERKEGNPNEPYISIGDNYPTGTVGLIHSHYEGALPIPSDGDVRALYQLWEANGRDRNFNPVFGIVAPNNSVYLLAISDIYKFEDFGDDFFSSATPNGILNAFGIDFSNSIDGLTTSEEKETALAKMFDKYDLGLKLMRSSTTDLGNWQSVKFSFGKLKRM